MPSQHAKLSPSASDRWISCPASIEMETKVPRPPESPYAEEGTAAHALGELKARYHFGMITEPKYRRGYESWLKEYDRILSMDNVDLDDMHLHTDAYVSLIEERMQLYPNSQLLLEQRVPTGVPTCWGTSDTVIVSPQHVEIIDLKYGAGVMVSAVDNSQLKLYGVGALENIAEILGKPKLVRLTIFQPRMEHVSTEELDPRDLKAWRDSILPVAEEALGDDAHFGPSEKACRWCPAAGRCAAQLEHATQADFGVDVALLTGSDVAEALAQVPFIKSWMASLEQAALDMAYSQGGEIPGYKVVISGGQRYINDAPAAIQHLKDLGYSDAQVSTTKAKGIGDLEKLLGKKEFPVVLADYISKSEGRPSLVPEDDKRSSATPNVEAAKEFS